MNDDDDDDDDDDEFAKVLQHVLKLALTKICLSPNLTIKN